MRILMILVVGILSVGCGKKLTPEEKALRDSVVGEYEFKDRRYKFKNRDGDTYKYVFLENGDREWYKNGKKLIEHTWSIVDGKIHIKGGPLGWMQVYKINPDNSITSIAGTYKGKRTDIPKEQQDTYIKIK
jgi:hypothetical protein